MSRVNDELHHAVQGKLQYNIKVLTAMTFEHSMGFGPPGHVIVNLHRAFLRAVYLSDKGILSTGGTPSVQQSSCTFVGTRRRKRK